MESKVVRLMEMGASRTQAIAALARYKDLDQAAERFFEGEFDGIDSSGENARSKTQQTPASNSGDSDMDYQAIEEDDNDEDVEDYADYDSEDGEKAVLAVGNVDPYAGIFFSKDRREEVIEIEEEPEHVFVQSSEGALEAMSQAEFMKGCPESGEQGFLFSLYDLLSNGSCICPNGCGYSLVRGKHQFFPLFPEFSLYVKHLESVVPQKCSRCNTQFCLACGEALHFNKMQSDGQSRILYHCSTLQGVVLGVGLYMLDRLFDQQTARHSQNTTDKPPTMKKRKTDHGGPGPGVKGKGAPGGTGYAGDVKEDLTGQQEAQAAQQAKDIETSNLFKDIRAFLPSLRRPGGSCASDYLVHPTTLAHLRRRFNRVCSTLLRNDSLADMSDRSILYYELFEWLSTISNHEALASMMGMPIMVVHSRNLRDMKNKSREYVVTYEGSAGPREILESIVIQAHAAIKGLEAGHVEDPAEKAGMTEEEKRKTFDAKGKEKVRSPQLEENERLLNFCRRILHTRDAIDRSLRETKGDEFLARLKQSLPTVPGHTGEGDHVSFNPDASVDELKRAYVEWATRSRFEYCDLSMPASNAEEAGETGAVTNWKFFYTAEARLLVNSDLPRRSLAIAKELAVLTTNLPVSWDSSIFLRVDETRVDIIKALIVGPPGTPYQNGCYLFDIFLGASYNQSPPSVKYMTTNGGRFRFNPNLYADGKVCLSLLGTWSGPGWTAGKSTLLQVLISIQSMILCEEPYLNEPGWANGSGSASSAAYSANVRRMVVHTAMLGNLRSPPEPFEEVIRTHFKLKSGEINQQLDHWLTTDDKVKKTADVEDFVGGSRHSEAVNLKADVAELKKLLSEL